MVKTPVSEVYVRTDWGIVGDAHADTWHRQVSVLAAESIERMRKGIPWLEQGMFGENLVTKGIDIFALSVGDKLIIDGGVLLEITQIGKECHNQGCSIQKATGDCIMPKEGLFCRVLQGGTVRPGLDVKRVKKSTDIPAPESK